MPDTPRPGSPAAPSETGGLPRPRFCDPRCAGGGFDVRLLPLSRGRPATASGWRHGADSLRPGISATRSALAKLRKDGVRLGQLSALSIVYALLFEQPILDVVLIALNGIGALVAALAAVVAFTAIRRQGRAALLALGVYGACLAGHRPRRGCSSAARLAPGVPARADSRLPGRSDMTSYAATLVA